MADISDLRRILNDTPASATDVDYNFQLLESYLDSDVVQADGSTAMTGALVLPGAPTADTHAATKAYVDSAGGVVGFGKMTAGTGVINEIDGYTAVPGLSATFTAVAGRLYRYSVSGYCLVASGVTEPWRLFLRVDDGQSRVMSINYYNGTDNPLVYLDNGSFVVDNISGSKTATVEVVQATTGLGGTMELNDAGSSLQFTVEDLGVTP